MKSRWWFGASTMLLGGRKLSNQTGLRPDAAGRQSPPPLRPRVLVVDDEIAIREWLQRALDVIGYDVVGAADATGAMKVLQGSRVDAAILDLRLVGHTGLEVLQYIRYRRDIAHLPVVILTGVSFLTEDEQETIRQLQAYVLYKPEAVDHIADLLERIVKTSPPLPGMA